MFSKVGLSKMMSVLVPFANNGEIVKYAFPRCASVFAIEEHPLRSEKMRLDGYDCRTAKFLEYEFDIPYSRVFMNPPREDEIACIHHAYEFVAKGGILMSVASEAAFDDKDFSKWIAKAKGQSEINKIDGMNVRLVWIEKKVGRFLAQ